MQFVHYLLQKPLLGGFFVSNLIVFMSRLSDSDRRPAVYKTAALTS